MLLLEDKWLKVKENLKISNYLGFDIENDCDCYDEIFHTAIQVKRLLKDRKAREAHGLSKMAIISDESAYVLKIPFSGQYIDEECYEDYGYDYDCECEKIDEEYYYVPFAYNYCEDEYNIYCEAVEDGYGDFFAKTLYYGNGLYLQEKVEVLSDCLGDSHSPSADSLEKAKRKIDVIDKVWLALAIDFYGEERVDDFINYIQANDISCDLHRSNIGFRVIDGSPCLIDTAGWEDGIC